MKNVVSKKQKTQWVIVGLIMLLGICLFFMLINKLENKGVFDRGGNQGIEQNVGTTEKEDILVDIDAMEEDRIYGKKQNVTLYKDKYYYRDDIQNFLIIGTDASGNQEAESEEYRGAMADFLMLIIVNHTEKTYSMLQINRDTMTEVKLINQDGTGEATAKLQICTSHWYGGTKKQSCKNTVQAVSKLLGGIKIDAYYALDMQAIGLLNQAVGGITVTIEDDFTQIDPNMQPGITLKLTDEQAYHYVHTRYGVAGEDNVSRMKRQQVYMQAYFKQVAPYLDEKDFIVTLYNQLTRYSTTNISGDDLNKMVSTTQAYDNKGIYTIEGEEKLGQSLGDGEDHVEYYVEKESHVEVMRELYNLQED